MLHMHRGLAHDEAAVLAQQVVDRVDGAGGAVLDGQHAVAAQTLPYGDEHAFKGPGRSAVAVLPEVLDGRLLAVGAGLSLIDDAVGVREPAL